MNTDQAKISFNLKKKLVKTHRKFIGTMPGHSELSGNEFIELNLSAAVSYLANIFLSTKYAVEDGYSQDNGQPFEINTKLFLHKLCSSLTDEILSLESKINSTGAANDEKI